MGWQPDPRPDRGHDQHGHRVPDRSHEQRSERRQDTAREDGAVILKKAAAHSFGTEASEPHLPTGALTCEGVGRPRHARTPNASSQYALFVIWSL